MGRFLKKKYRSFERLSIVVILLAGILTVSSLSNPLHGFAQTKTQFQQPDGEKIKQILAHFEEYAEKGMKERGIPGMAIAIVQGDKIIYKKAFGVKKIGGNDPVTERTIFQIGSTSKAFTSALLAMLVDEGKFHWDDRVIDNLPDFRMYDPWVTREFRVKDLMAQHSGMPSHSGDDQSFLGFGREHIIRSIRYIKPVSSFRLEYAYQNNLFLVAAKLARKYTGKSWEENIKERILLPLDMSESTMDSKSFLEAEDVVYSHKKTGGKVISLPMERPYFEWTYIYGPAGGINSNIIDMAKWLRMQLNGGVFNSKRLVSEKNMEFMHSPKTIMVREKNQPMQYYCQAWIYREYNPYPIIWHNGGTLGINTMVALVPEAKVGIVVLANMTDAFPLSDQLAYRFFDMYFDKPARDWNAEAIVQAAKLEGKSMEKTPKRPSPVTPAMPLADYTGDYRSDMFGKITVSEKNASLCITIGPENVKFPLQHWSGNVFSVATPGFIIADEKFASFQVGPDGKASEVTIAFLNGCGCGIFRRVNK